MRLIESNPAAYRPLGEIKTHDPREQTLNLVDLVMPVLFGGKPHLRTCDERICYDVSSK